VPELALIAVGVFHAIAYTGYIWLVGAAGPVFSSQISYVVTLAGVITSALVLGETYSAWVWAALALMICGLALVQPKQAETAEQH
jgi:drug/metabolite transporter (DMT)-like permease